MDKASGVICFSLCAGKEDLLPPLHSPHPFCLCLCLEVWQTGGMGGSQSKNTPHQNFKRGFNGDYRVKLTSDKLRTFCEIDWPTLGVGWPSEGSLDKVIVNRAFCSGCRGA
jgi:hypothetical protein